MVTLAPPPSSLPTNSPGLPAAAETGQGGRQVRRVVGDGHGLPVESGQRLREAALMVESAGENARRYWRDGAFVFPHSIMLGAATRP